MTITTVVEAISTTTKTSTSPPMTRDTVARIVWASIAEPGDTTVGALVAACGAEHALDLLRDGSTTMPAGVDFAGLRQRLLPRYQSAATAETVQASIAAGTTVLTPAHPDWPAQLGDLGFATPLILWVRGSTAVLPGRSVLLTGDQDSTAYGRHMAIDLASGLGARGYAIVSGAARGIEHAALASAAASGGHPIAVLPGQVSTRLPGRRSSLLDQVAENGAIVSELPPGAPLASPRSGRNVRRGQVLTALSAKTVIVDAHTFTPAMGAARRARELGRPLGVVPGLAAALASSGFQRLVDGFGALVVSSPYEADWL